MSEDEEDYMSDAFLNAAPDQDIRPGLIRSREQKRDQELWKKNQEALKNRRDRTTIKKREEEIRAEGLNKPIDEGNKGFAMLTKMGFDRGKGLGRYGQGRTEPVNIDLKIDKQGLGRKTAVMEIMERKRKILEERKNKAPSVEGFRANLSEKVQERQTNLDLMKSQRACYTMDKDLGYEEADEIWFWPEFTKPETEDDEEDTNELSSKEKLELITMYLRRNHHYCVWCGVKYDNDEDMRDCPGPTSYDHDV